MTVEHILKGVVALIIISLFFHEMYTSFFLQYAVLFYIVAVKMKTLYYKTVPWLSFRRVFKAFCGLLSVYVIRCFGINKDIRDITT
jgi:hypothetical protein